MNELFEVISKEEFESSGVVTTSDNVRVGEVNASGPTPYPHELEWCEFCKGYYIMANHFGESEDESSR